MAVGEPIPEFVSEAISKAYALFRNHWDEHNGPLSKREDDIALMAIAFGLMFGVGLSAGELSAWQKMVKN